MSIIWLASYPKSGNTWLRAQLTAWQADDGETPDLNTLLGHPLADQRELMDEYCGLNTGDLKVAELDRLRPPYHAAIADNLDNPTFVKTHGAYRLNDFGDPVFASSGCDGVIYILRDPQDIVPSFAHHLNRDYDKIIDMMKDPDMTLGGVKHGIGPNLPEFVGCWQNHVLGWTEQTDLPMLLIRYQDMLADPGAQLARALRFAGLDDDPGRVARAVRVTGIDALRQREKNHGTAIQPLGGGAFFRRGQSGDGARQLSATRLNRLAELSTLFDTFTSETHGQSDRPA